MKCKLKLLFYFLSALILLSYNGHAQTKNSLSGASLVPLPDSTFLRDSISGKDSIVKWKQSREFVYMHYLDSLLRKEKNLRSDTVHIDQSNGNIKRNHPRGQHRGLNNLLNSLPFQLFFWLLAIIFIAYIFYKVLLKNGIFTTKRNKSSISISEEEAQNELSELSQYDGLIEDAESRNDFNLATRYLFLKTLKTLSEKGFINFTAVKTNKEYLKEMEQNNYYEEFEKLTSSYEYAWYGKFLLHENYYRKLKEEFNLFNQNV